MKRLRRAKERQRPREPRRRRCCDFWRPRHVFMFEIVEVASPVKEDEERHPFCAPRQRRGARAATATLLEAAIISTNEAHPLAVRARGLPPRRRPQNSEGHGARRVVLGQRRARADADARLHARRRDTGRLGPVGRARRAGALAALPHAARLHRGGAARARRRVGARLARAEAVAVARLAVAGVRRGVRAQRRPRQDAREAGVPPGARRPRGGRGGGGRGGGRGVCEPAARRGGERGEPRQVVRRRRAVVDVAPRDGRAAADADALGALAARVRGRAPRPARRAAQRGRRVARARPLARRAAAAVDGLGSPALGRATAPARRPHRPRVRLAPRAR